MRARWGWRRQDSWGGLAPTNFFFCQRFAIENWILGSLGRKWPKTLSRPRRICRQNDCVCACVLPAFCMHFAFVFPAFCMRFACVLPAFCLRFPCVLHALCMRFTCILRAFCLCFAYVLPAFLPAFCMRCACFLACVCLLLCMRSGGCALDVWARWMERGTGLSESWRQVRRWRLAASGGEERRPRRTEGARRAASSSALVEQSERGGCGKATG